MAISRDRVLAILPEYANHPIDLTLRVGDCPTAFQYTGVVRATTADLKGWQFAVLPEAQGDLILLDLGIDGYDAFAASETEGFIATKGNHRLELTPNSANFDD